MYNVLAKILIYLEEAKKYTFTANEIVELTGLCKKSVTNNLSRLESLHYITRERTNLEKPGIFITYKINEEVIDFIKDVLY